MVLFHRIAASARYAAPLLRRRRSTLATCVLVYLVVSLLLRVPLDALCLSPWPVLRGQVWRPLTAVLSHASALHLAFNMLALVPLGAFDWGGGWGGWVGWVGLGWVGGFVLRMWVDG